MKISGMDEVMKMKSFYRRYLDLSYRYIDVTCDGGIGERPIYFSVRRVIHVSDEDIDNFKKSQRFYYRFINTYRIECFYPADMEHDAIIFCKSKLGESIRQKLSKEIERINCLLNCLQSSEDKVTEIDSIPEIYRECGCSKDADRYIDFDGCENKD